MPAGFEQGEAIETERCSGTTEVTCELGGVAPAGEPTLVAIPVRVSPAAEPAAGEAAPVDLVSVSGGGAPGEAKSRVPVVVGSGSAGLGSRMLMGGLRTQTAQSIRRPALTRIRCRSRSRLIAWVLVMAGKTRRSERRTR